MSATIEDQLEEIDHRGRVRTSFQNPRTEILMTAYKNDTMVVLDANPFHVEDVSYKESTDTIIFDCVIQSAQTRQEL